MISIQQPYRSCARRRGCRSRTGQEYGKLKTSMYLRFLNSLFKALVHTNLPSYSFALKTSISSVRANLGLAYGYRQNNGWKSRTIQYLR